ncbi:unnamed protein product [Penicillium manginii]
MELVALLHVLEIELKTKDHRVNSVAELGTARKSLGTISGAGARICTPLALRKDPGIPNARETNHTGGSSRTGTPQIQPHTRSVDGPRQ